MKKKDAPALYALAEALLAVAGTIISCRFTPHLHTNYYTAKELATKQTWR